METPEEKRRRSEEDSIQIIQWAFIGFVILGILGFGYEMLKFLDIIK